MAYKRILCIGLRWHRGNVSPLAQHIAVLRAGLFCSVFVLVPTSYWGVTVTIVSVPPSLEEATFLASSGFARDVSDELLLDVKQHMESGDIVLGIKYENEYVGFVILCVWGDVLYLSGIILHQDYQRHASVVDVIQYVRQAEQVKYFALRTQSPRMWSAAKKVCRRWYPDFGLECIDPDLEDVGRLVAERIESQFPYHRGCYGSALYGEKPTHHDSEIQIWWDENCDFDSGDAVICVGELK